MEFRELFRKKTVEMILRDARGDPGSPAQLRKNLTVRDLTGFGIAAIVGAGIFSTIGNAAASGGPAVSLLFVFTAIACGFSALCYARFASRIPISGSAYTYSYASFGELVAWIIGWDLIMEYAVGNIAVAISWSDYFTGLLSGLGVAFPEYFGIDYLTASRGFHEALRLLSRGTPVADLPGTIREAYAAWTGAPVIGNIRLIADIPAFSITVLITWLVYRGIYETKIASNIMVLLKISILLLVIGVGAFYVHPPNWHPFAPNGIGGVLKGIAGVFFAYIGFDAISTTAEECRNPGRDLPRSMIYALVITTILYILISLVLTGMIHYSELGVGDPLAYAFQKLHLTGLSGVIAVSAVIAMAGVLLVFQVGQPRIWMTMSRDGLLPRIFSRLHPRHRTPAFSTILTGIVVAVPSLFLNLTEVTDLTSIGTLFAFILVSGGVLVLDEQDKKTGTTGQGTSFRIPYLNSRYFLPALWIILFFLLFISNTGDLLPPPSSLLLLLTSNIPLLIFVLFALLFTVLGVIRKLSLIPVLGLITNFYLIIHLGWTNWMRFVVWLLIGLFIYFAFGRKHSLLNHPPAKQ